MMPGCLMLVPDVEPAPDVKDIGALALAILRAAGDGLQKGRARRV
jgi:hypothetical protein